MNIIIIYLDRINGNIKNIYSTKRGKHALYSSYNYNIIYKRTRIEDRDWNTHFSEYIDKIIIDLDNYKLGEHYIVDNYLLKYRIMKVKKLEDKINANEFGYDYDNSIFNRTYTVNLDLYQHGDDYIIYHVIMLIRKEKLTKLKKKIKHGIVC